MLDLQNVAIRFGHGPEAVSDTNFHVDARKRTVVIGETGSGKSVLLLAILGLLPPSASIQGKILFEGEDLLALRERQMERIRGAKIAYIPQGSGNGLNPLYTVGNQLEEVLKLHMGLKGEAATKRAIELLDMVSIPQPETRVTQYPHEFSGGMRQRVMIAMALACDPTILIADEPTTALDVTIQAQILELMKDLQKKISTSIIMITHDLGIVSDLCDRVNVMYGSQIMESGTVDDLFYRTSHPYTRGLLRCLPESVQNLEDKRLHPIMGSPVDLMMLPAGCAFSARCDDCMKLCLNRRPELFEVNPGHTSRCWLTALENAAKEVQA